MKSGLELPSPTRGKPSTRAAPRVTSAAVNEKDGLRDQDPSRSQPFQAEINYNICINWSDSTRARAVTENNSQIKSLKQFAVSVFLSLL